MATSNRDRLTKVMDTLKIGLGPFVVREYKRVYGKDYAREIDAVVTTNVYELPQAVLKSDEALLSELDTQRCLNLLWKRFNEVFQEKLGHTGRSYVSELTTARNEWAHQKAFTNEEAYRASDTAELLLKMVGAAEAAQVVQTISKELLRLRFEAEAQKAVKKTGPLADERQTTSAGLSPWRMIVQPHPDVASGRYLQAEFAADLAQVVQGNADKEYGDPVEFFRRTYLTEGLTTLLATGVHRLTGQGGDPVVQLQTPFGGGKTHSMLALYHLLGGKIKLSDIPGGEELAKQIGSVDLPQANRAVIVGTAFNPANPRQYKDVTTHTVWGEIAYQLGGAKGYQLVAQADMAGVNPGADTLLEVLEQFGPALIIIDELVAFARNLYGITERLPAGSFDTVMSFIQSLTEAAKRSSDSMLLVSIPESDMEIGGEGGKATLEALAKYIGRIEAVWKPVTALESFEIVRRRLFATQIDYAARDAVLNAFRDLYGESKSEFPQGVAEGDYFSRMRAAYPIHPELFDRLYQDWSTLERFQRTRGVLRLMAAVIHELWAQSDQSLLIMPGTIPLDASAVRNEMLRYLPDGWSAIVDTDIDGPGSRPFAIDSDVPTLGRYTASRRVARSIFVGSAPSVAAQAVRGVEEVRIRLATVQPGESLAAFGDALRRMSNQLTYLYSDGSRYWYDTRPTVNRIAADRAQAVHPDWIYQEAVRRLKAVKYDRADFAAAHVAPTSSGDVVDEQRARVVVFSLLEPHKRNNGGSQALTAAKEILESRGNAPRLYRNMLVFIAPDQGDAEALEKAIRDYLAWQSIKDEEEQLNLDAQQRKQVQSALKRTDETVDLRLQGTYSWLLVPTQPDPTGPIEWQYHRITGEDTFYQRAARKLRQSELLIRQWSGDNLSKELDNFLWGDRPHLGLKQLWEYFASYCYLPRLYDQDVLLGAVRDGISSQNAYFAYATSVTQEGEYRGLVYQTSGSIYFDSNSVIVRREVAEAQLEREWAERERKKGVTESGGTKVSSFDKGSKSSTTPPEPEPAVLSRYHGSVSVDPLRVNRELPLIVEEVIQRLTSLTGCTVRITLEIDAERPEGFDEGTVRTISENSRTLKFNGYQFESE
jgi:predicted AAA+ superfamily ATPase